MCTHAQKERERQTETENRTLTKYPKSRCLQSQNMMKMKLLSPSVPLVADPELHRLGKNPPTHNIIYTNPHVTSAKPQVRVLSL